ncbi:ABC transporter ATP-binding protein [Bacillus sp. FSL W7-1360]
MLVVEHLTVQLAGHRVLTDVSFSVQKGKMVGVLGQNGSGKTTLLRAIAGDYKVSSGSILIEGQASQMLSPKNRARKLAVCMQNHHVPLHVTVQEAVTLGRYPYEHGWLSRRSKRDGDIVERVMRDTDTIELANRLIGQLSGGEQKRVWLAQSLAQEPSLLLLDEPTNHLDIAQQVAFMNHLHKLQQERELSVVIVLHDVNMMSLYCDEWVLLKQGQVLGTGAVTNLTESLLHEAYGVRFTESLVPPLGKKQFTICP